MSDLAYLLWIGEAYWEANESDYLWDLGLDFSDFHGVIFTTEFRRDGFDCLGLRMRTGQEETTYHLLKMIDSGTIITHDTWSIETVLEWAA